MRCDSKPFKLRALQREAVSTSEKATRADGGGAGRHFQSTAQGERPFLAPAGLLEGSAALCVPACPSLPRRFAFPDPLPHAAESSADCSLHRPSASANGGACCSKMAQIIPMVAGSEAAAKEAAVGGACGAQGGPVDEGRPRGRPWPRPGQSQPPPAP